MFADLTLQRSLAVNEAGDLARRRIKRLTEELSQLIKRVIKIEFEILQGEKGELEQEVIAGAADRRAARPATKPIDEIRADDEHEIWPFIGEYWRDELGYYRVKIREQVSAQRARGRAGDWRGRGAGRARRRRRVAGRREGGGAPTP